MSHKRTFTPLTLQRAINPLLPGTSSIYNRHTNNLKKSPNISSADIHINTAAMPTPPPLVRNQSSKTTRFCIEPIDTSLSAISVSSPSAHGHAANCSTKCSSDTPDAEGCKQVRTGTTSAPKTPLTPCMKHTGYAPATLELAAVTPLPSSPADGLGRLDYFGDAAEDADDAARADSVRGGRLSVEIHELDGVAEQLDSLDLTEAVAIGQQVHVQKEGGGTLIKPIPYEDGVSPFHSPLASHLALLHPNTPKEVIHFIATRMLTTEYPLGYTTAPDLTKDGHDGKLAGERGAETSPSPTPALSPKEEADSKGWTWTPVWTSEEDVQRAGVALDASKETRETCRVDEGKRADERLEWMEGVARRGWEAVNARMGGADALEMEAGREHDVGTRCEVTSGKGVK